MLFPKDGRRMPTDVMRKVFPLRCGSAGSADWLDSVPDIERVTRASQLLGLARSRGRGREAQQFADGIEIRANSRSVRAFLGMALPIQEQGFYDLPVIGIANRLQRCSAAKGSNLLVNPIFDLFLDHFLDSASRLWITTKGLSEFVVPLRLCFEVFGRFGEHFVGRLSDCVLAGDRST